MFSAKVPSLLEFQYQTDEHLSHKYAMLSVLREKQKQKADPKAKELEEKERKVRHLLVPEAIITVSYFRAQNSVSTPDPTRKNMPVRSLHLITQNTLADLRDAIKCAKDLEIPGDFSQNPEDVKTTKTAKEIFPSAMFFIEDTFYIDKRSLKVQDYSVNIVNWLKRKGVTKEFPVKSMTRTTILNLEIRLGMPYVYIHQGNCEHLIQFTDMRLLNSDDCQELQAYPISFTMTRNKFLICNVCQMRAVKWTVSNSTISPTEPAHYCDICFKMSHYDSTGAKICDFTAHAYTDNAFNASLS